MPQVIVGAAIGAFASVGIGALVGGTFSWALIGKTFLTNLVLGGLSQALNKPPSGGTLQTTGQTVSARNPAAAHNIIYGRTRVGGTIVHMEATESNKYLHLVIAVAGHEIDAFETVYFDDEALDLDANGVGYGGKARIKFKLGTDDQTAFSELVNESASGWTNNHRLRGRACAYVRLEYDQDKFPNGVPNISFLIRGKKVFDPRTSTTAWSANPALCLNDYLTNSKYGLSCIYNKEIDSAALIASANICDEVITLASGGTEPRYQANGAISTSNTPQDIINSILSSMAGKAIFSGGLWRILAGAYYSPVLTFDENDLRAGFRVQALVSRRENFNCIKGVFSSKDEKYIVTDFPPIISDAFIAQDNGEAVYKNIQLPLTTSVSMAQRLAKIELLKARQQLTLSLPLKLHGLQANVGDIVRVNNTRMGWSLKPFEIISMQMSLGEALGVDLELREINTDVFDWSVSEEQVYDPSPNSNLPNIFFVAPPSELAVTDVSAVMNDGSLQPQLLVTWTPSTDAFASSYEVQWLRGEYGTIPAETAWNSVFVYEPKYTIPSIIPTAEYTIRIRAVNTVGVKSAFVSIDNVSNGGDITAPSAPSSLTAVGGFRQIKLTWINPTQTDLKTIDIYRNTTNNSGSATKIATTTSSAFTDTGLGISQTFYYWARAVDFSDNTSEFSTVATATSSFIDNADFENGIYDLFVQQGLYAISDAASLPASGSFVGEKIYNTTDGKLYQWTGTAWVSLVSDASIADGSITTTKIADDAITSPKIAANTITGDKIAANTITGGLIAASGIITNTAQINDGLITNAKIANLAVDTAKIADASITTAKIVDANITTAKIADANITTAKIADANITTAKIADASITSAKIGDAEITSAKIADAAITNAKIVDLYVEKLSGDVTRHAIYTNDVEGFCSEAGVTVINQTFPANDIAQYVEVAVSVALLNTTTSNGTSEFPVTAEIRIGGTLRRTAKTYLSRLGTSTGYLSAAAINASKVTTATTVTVVLKAVGNIKYSSVTCKVTGYSK